MSQNKSTQDTLNQTENFVGFFDLPQVKAERDRQKAWEATVEGERHWTLVCDEMKLEQQITNLELMAALTPLELESKNRQLLGLNDSLKAVRDEMDSIESPPAAKVEAANAGTNEKKWGDVELQALWKESLLPGATNVSLGKKHHVSRQRISALLKTAKEKFSVGKSTAKLAAFSGTTISRKTKGKNY